MGRTVCSLLPKMQNKGYDPLPKILPGSEPEAPLAEGVPRLHPHLAQRLETSRSVQAELAAAGWLGAGWRGHRSERQGCVPSMSPCLQLSDPCRPGLTVLPDTAAPSWQYLEPFPSSQCAHPSVSREDAQAGWGLPTPEPPRTRVSLSHKGWC